MTPPALLAAALTAPWVVFAALALSHRLAFALLPWAALPALLVVAVVPDQATLVLTAPGADVVFALDAVTRAFLLPAALLWMVAGAFARHWFDTEREGARFAGFWLAAMAGNLTLILASDLLTFYSGFTLMTFAAWGLVVHDGNRAALRAGRLYLAMMLAGEICLFTAVAWVTAAAPEPSLPPLAGAAAAPAPLLLFAMGFGLKLGVFGLHSWLPRAHATAPTPASAVLSGLMIKAGALGGWRVADPAAMDLAAVAPVLIALGLAGALYAVVAGLRQANPKSVLAWSSVSQMGLLVVLGGVAAALPGSHAWTATALLVLHHGLAKGALFLGVGLLTRCSHARRRAVWLLLWLPALAIAGAPGTSGALVKVAVDAATHEYAPWLAPAVAAVAIGSTLLMARVLYVTHAPSDSEMQRNDTTPPGIAWGLLLLAVLILPWLLPIAAGPAAIALAPSGIASTTWPVAVGALVAVAALATGLRAPHRNRWRALTRPDPSPVLHSLARVEQRLRRWPVVGRAAIIVAVVLLTVLWTAHPGP